ncbi:DUF4365 domain-containing protein [Schaalia sp. JY-X169]|uniref:DUF4365 domain-containing protein n=1 Tax=Schaalia sp. JY-X169 TaxID=2758572 RepID=UPI0015F5ED8F|nr:DUF4365 domain-containing protein [Schaalia sp. JY-X169]
MPKKVKHSAQQDRKGIAAVQQIITSDLAWIFREQSTDDYGIDAQIEVVEDDAATGQLLAAQIKTGPSYFKKETCEGWWYALKKNDLSYWLEHALPVVVIICDPVTGSAYWQAVNDHTVVTGRRGGKKLHIPREQELSQRSKFELERIAEGKPYELRVRKLRLSLPWMRLLQSGRRILLEVDEWVNKTSGRGDVKIVSVDEGNEDRVELGSWFIMVGLRPYEDVLPSLFPWADTVLHEETYDEADHEAWEAECVYCDREGDRFVSEAFEEWMIGRGGDGRLRPYSNSVNEVDHWRLELVLNDLGRGFLEVDRYAEGKGMVLAPKRR